MVNFESLVISLPAYELSGACLAESVFAATELKKMSLPPDLRTAVELIVNNCPTSTVLRCVARPEIFPNGVPLEWLKKRLAGVTDHLHLSDGTSVKLIPELRNHVFVYGLQSAERLATFKKLTRRAPELLPQFQTQINSFHRGCSSRAPISPAPQIVMLKTPFPNQMLWFYAFYLNPHSIDDSVDHMLNWGGFEEKNLVQFDRVTYLPLTDICAKDAQFQKMLCESIAMTYFEPKHCLLLRLPSPGEELATRMKRGLECVQGARLQLPRARAANVFFLADDLSEQALQRLGARLSFILHQSFEFWRYTKRLYESAKKVTYYSTTDANTMFDDEVRFLTEAFGQQPAVVPPKYALDGSFVLEPVV